MEYFVNYILPELLEGATVILAGLAYYVYKHYRYRSGVRKWMAMTEYAIEHKRPGLTLGYIDIKPLRKEGFRIDELDLKTFNGWNHINNRRMHPHDVNKHGGLF